MSSDFDAVLITMTALAAILLSHMENALSDLLYIVMFMGCCLVTGGLAAMCARLMPQETRSKP